MKKGLIVKAIYKGDQFPEYKGKEVEARDDFSVDTEAYEVRFPGKKFFNQKHSFTLKDIELKK